MKKSLSLVAVLLLNFVFSQMASAAFITIEGDSSDPLLVNPVINQNGENTASSTMIHGSGPAGSFTDTFTISVNETTNLVGDYGFTLANLTVSSVELFKDGNLIGNYLLSNGNYQGSFLFEAGSTYALKVMAAISGNRTATSSLSVNSEVPVPAAVWLFGSAIAGLMGFARRRQSIAG